MLSDRASSETCAQLATDQKAQRTWISPSKTIVCSSSVLAIRHQHLSQVPSLWSLANTFFFPLVGSGNETDSDGSIPELEEPSGTLLRPSNPQVGCRFMSGFE